MSATKGAWFISAGVIPGVPCAELAVRLNYTAEDYETDRRRAEHDKTTFEALRDQALEQVRGLSVPTQVSWVTLQFIWF